MTTYNTGNALGSTDPRDLYDNAQNFDGAINGTSEKWTDRLGRERLSWDGMQANISPLGKTYTQDQATAAIASGEIPDGAFFFIWSDDEGAVAEKYQNVGGVITPTGVKISSEQFVQMVY
ncbi:hypothetical protein RF070_15450, partial [Serratia marcescens]|nr:hypothetical protein [Serratia marcescens]